MPGHDLTKGIGLPTGVSANTSTNISPAIAGKTGTPAGSGNDLIVSYTDVFTELPPSTQPVKFWPFPECLRLTRGAVQVYYYNGYLYWDFKVGDDQIRLSYELSKYPVDLVRGMAGAFWSYSNDPPGQKTPLLQGPVFTSGKVSNFISYNNFNINETPEIITLEFAKAHPEDQKNPLVYGLRVLVDPGDYTPNAGGIYPISIVPATVDAKGDPIMVDGQIVGHVDPKTDDVVTLDEVNSSFIFPPYSRDTTGWRSNDGWEKAGLSDIYPIPYNKETLILKTNQDIFVVKDSNKEQFPKEGRFQGSAFLRLIERITDDEKKMLGAFEPYHQAHPFKDDHSFVFEQPWQSFAESQQQGEGTIQHYVETENRYNYYNKDYEEAAASDLIQEPLLPSLLTTGARELSDFENKWDEKIDGAIATSGSPLDKLRQNIYDFISLSGRMPFTLVDNFYEKAKRKDLRIDVGQYFQKWSETIKYARIYINAVTPDDADLPEDLQATTRQFRSQIILPDLVAPLPVLPEPNTSNATTFINKKDPLSYESRKLMFPAYTQIKIGTHAEKIHKSGQTHSLLNFIIKNHLSLPLLRAVQERADDLTFNTDRSVGTDKQFWAKNTYSHVVNVRDGGWDSFTLNKKTSEAKSHDFSVENETANIDTKGNDLFFYRNPYPNMRPEKSEPGGGAETYSPSHRSWLHYYFTEGVNAYDRLPRSDEYPGEASNIVAASHGDDTDVSYGMNLLLNQDVNPMAANQLELMRTNMVNALVADINKIAREKTRTLEQICKDALLACDETLFWRIEKTKIKSNGSEEKIQNFYLLNDPTKNELNFVDTQVKYGGQYKYRIYAWKAVFGTETEYQFPTSYAADPKRGRDFGTLRVNQVEEGTGFLGVDNPALPGGTFLGTPFIAAGTNSTEEEEGAGFLGVDNTTLPGGTFLGTPFIAGMNSTEEEGSGFLGVDNTTLPGGTLLGGLLEFDETNPVKELTESVATDEELAEAGVTNILNEPTKVDYGDAQWQLILDALSFPSIRIVETLFHETAPQLISDRPPLPPMMEIHPYRGINDTYLIRLNATVGQSVKARPQILLTGDADKYADNYVSQYPSVKNMATSLRNLLIAASGLTSEDYFGGTTTSEATASFEALYGPLTFRSDDPPKQFEVFMLGPDPETGSARPPKSYIDFAKAERMVLPIEQGVSTSFRPEITPNKKYYYTFRSMDVHGNISFPSKIYEIELVDDSGAIYLVTNTYEFPKQEKIMKKDVRKFMNIIPTPDQTIFKRPENGSYINFTPEMGPLFENNRRYKFRLTSKNSGKKLDINVKVKLTKRKTEEEKTS